MKNKWPSLSYPKSKNTYETVHLWTQILGKIKLATLPWANHSWNVALHVVANGLTTGCMPYKGKNFQIDLDLTAHELKISTCEGESEMFILTNVSVKEFYEKIFNKLKSLDINISIMSVPAEIEKPTPFEVDTVHSSYDENEVIAFHHALLAIQNVFMVFRTGFIGKASPIHFFWGGFDLALAFFSGRIAPKHGGKFPGLPDWVLQDAYSHELMDFGFWTGNSAFPEAAFYCYLYPEPYGYDKAFIKPSDAYYHKNLREFILPYSEVRKSENPEKMLLEFLVSTYQIGAQLANWRDDLWKELRL